MDDCVETECLQRRLVDAEVSEDGGSRMHPGSEWLENFAEALAQIAVRIGHWLDSHEANSFALVVENAEHLNFHLALIAILGGGAQTDDSHLHVFVHAPYVAHFGMDCRCAHGAQQSEEVFHVEVVNLHKNEGL